MMKPSMIAILAGAIWSAGCGGALVRADGTPDERPEVCRVPSSFANGCLMTPVGAMVCAMGDGTEWVLSGDGVAVHETTTAGTTTAGSVGVTTMLCSLRADGSVAWARPEVDGGR